MPGDGWLLRAGCGSWTLGVGGPCGLAADSTGDGGISELMECVDEAGGSGGKDLWDCIRSKGGATWCQGGRDRAGAGGGGDTEGVRTTGDGDGGSVRRLMACCLCRSIAAGPAHRSCSRRVIFVGVGGPPDALTKLAGGDWAGGVAGFCGWSVNAEWQGADWGGRVNDWGGEAAGGGIKGVGRGFGVAV